MSMFPNAPSGDNSDNTTNGAAAPARDDFVDTVRELKSTNAAVGARLDQLEVDILQMHKGQLVTACGLALVVVALYVFAKRGSLAGV